MPKAAAPAPLPLHPELPLPDPVARVVPSLGLHHQRRGPQVEEQQRQGQAEVVVPRPRDPANSNSLVLFRSTSGVVPISNPSCCSLIRATGAMGLPYAAVWTMALVPIFTASSFGFHDPRPPGHRRR